ncbi:hypothetical protein [Andreprevotia chitinilytica]|uniref:hypothetical protein n=1 Tax=Andreprevotia chitinilytica TaxID=396808 RepID=UPI000557052C|nr:hypothetical protein [Andreprevotia chitinilytica]
MPDLPSYYPEYPVVPPAPFNDLNEQPAIDPAGLAYMGMDCAAELGRLFKIMTYLTEHGSAAHQLARSGMQLAENRRSAIDLARLYVEGRSDAGERRDRR